MNEGRFQVAAGAVIERKDDGKILLLQCSNKKHIGTGMWEIPVGRLKQFEVFFDGLKREILKKQEYPTLR